MPCILIKSRCVSLKKGSHLVDEGTCATGTDTVHTLLNISVLKIDDLGILATKLNGYIGLRSQFLKRSGNSNNFLDKRYCQVIGKSQSAGTCDDRAESELAKLVLSFLKKICKCFLDICKMSLVIGEYKIIIFV